jgi:dUTP pyrophosphatase
MFISKLSAQETYNAYYDEVMPESFVYPYSKAIVQAIVTPVLETNEQELSYEDLKAIPSERGLGKLGSSLK